MCLRSLGKEFDNAGALLVQKSVLATYITWSHNVIMLIQGNEVEDKSLSFLLQKEWMFQLLHFYFKQFSVFLLSPFSSLRLWKQQFEWRHVRRWLPLHYQHRLLLSVHQYYECQAQRLSRYDLARDGRPPALLPRCVLRCRSREGHAGRPHGGWEGSMEVVS